MTKQQHTNLLADIAKRVLLSAGSGGLMFVFLRGGMVFSLLRSRILGGLFGVGMFIIIMVLDIYHYEHRS